MRWENDISIVVEVEGQVNPYLSSQGRRDPNDRYIRFFLHGLAFSLIMMVLALFWAFLALILGICGGCLGIILALVLLIYMMGWVNTWLMDLIWHRQRTDAEWWDPLPHGLLLLVVLFVLASPSWLLQSAFPEIDNWPFLLIRISIFLVYCLIDGYAAYMVGGVFSGERGPSRPTMEPPQGPPPMPPDGPSEPEPP